MKFDFIKPCDHVIMKSLEMLCVNLNSICVTWSPYCETLVASTFIEGVRQIFLNAAQICKLDVVGNTLICI